MKKRITSYLSKENSEKMDKIVQNKGDISQTTNEALNVWLSDTGFFDFADLLGIGLMIINIDQWIKKNCFLMKLEDLDDTIVSCQLDKDGIDFCCHLTAIRNQHNDLRFFQFDSKQVFAGHGVKIYFDENKFLNQIQSYY
jgi:hypothetical protein